MVSSSLEPAGDVIDVEELLARCMGNSAIAARILKKFKERFEIDLQELEDAMDAQDVETLTRIAHRVKGASANVSAQAICAIASRIEQTGRATGWSEIPVALEQLRTEWARFVDGTTTLEF